MVNRQIAVKNILGTDLELCCIDPVTGFFRDGFCHTNQADVGTHVICAVVTDAFLKYSLSRGNDLITPRPDYQFPGLKAGDGWCLCAQRWKEAHHAGCAPPIKPRSTHEKALEMIEYNLLQAYFIQDEK